MKKLEAKKIFNGNAEFIFGAHTYAQIPKNHFPEIAFLGASNVGKSSLVNALLGKKVAIVSSVPGRTRQLNFFKILGFEDGFMLVDMPGYGFAKADAKHVEHWQKTALEYLHKRPNLKRLYLLIDPTKGLKQADLDVINMFNAFAISFQIVLTKTDKISREEVEKVREKIVKATASSAAMHPQILTSSASKGYGIDDIQNSIIDVLQRL